MNNNYVVFIYDLFRMMFVIRVQGYRKLLGSLMRVRATGNSWTAPLDRQVGDKNQKYPAGGRQRPAANKATFY